MVCLDNGSQRLVFAIFAGVGLVCAFVMWLVPVGLSLLALIIALVALGATILAFATKDYFFMFDAILHMKNMSAVIDGNDPFYLAPNGNSILVRRGGDIFATAFIKIPVYDSATEMSDEQKYNFSLLFARLISISKTPMRLSSQLNTINKDEYIVRINTKLNESEGRYNTLQGDSTTDPKALDRIKGEVTMWRNLLDNVSRSNSQELMVYASITALGNSEDEAINLVAIKADEISAGISATLGVTATIVTGNEILVFIEPDYMIPPTTISEVMKYKGMATA